MGRGLRLVRDDEQEFEREHQAWLAALPTNDLAASVAALRKWSEVEPVPAQEEFDAILARLEELTRG